ncbi:putative beta-1-4-xylosyltransferase [Nymphaea thermarum]|nr:putative beta-1-4-xylosyltransferase [Nymphaea thermarum]
MEDVISLRCVVHKKVPPHQLHPPLHCQIPSRRDPHQVLLQVSDLRHRHGDGKRFPVEHITEWKNVALFEDDRDASQVDSFHDSRACDFITRWTEAIPALLHEAGRMGPCIPPAKKARIGRREVVQVYEYLPKKLHYYDLMKKSRYCLCPSSYEVASPRTVEAIYLGCVPVILKEGYVLPFSDVLNWKSFSVTVPVSEIRNLKKNLMGISTRRYLTMQRRVKLVRRHFLVNNAPKRYDIFHVRLRRLNQRPHIGFKNWTRF